MRDMLNDGSGSDSDCGHVSSPTRRTDDTLTFILSWLKRDLTDGVLGRQRAAMRLRKLEAVWDTHRPQARDLDFDTWVRDAVAASGAGYFRRLAAAVDLVGRSGSSEMSTEALTRVANVSDEHRNTVVTEVHKLFKGLGGKRSRAVRGIPLTLSQVARIIAATVGSKPRKAHGEDCERCARLEEQLVKAGIKPVE